VISGRQGFTSIELVVTLLILAVLTPPLGGLLGDLGRVYRLETARETLAELLTAARWTALSTGGASVVIQASPPQAWLVDAGDQRVRTVTLGPGVEVLLSRGRPLAELRFGPMGLGLVSSQTVRFRAGGVERRLVISALGRVSRR